jgi:hypothetical protein
MDGSLSKSSLRIAGLLCDVCDACPAASGSCKLLAAVIDCDVKDFRQAHDLPPFPLRSDLHADDASALKLSSRRHCRTQSFGPR